MIPHGSQRLGGVVGPRRPGVPQRVHEGPPGLAGRPLPQRVNRGLANLGRQVEHGPLRQADAGRSPGDVGHHVDEDQPQWHVLGREDLHHRRQCFRPQPRGRLAAPLQPEGRSHLPRVAAIPVRVLRREAVQIRM